MRTLVTITLLTSLVTGAHTQGLEQLLYPSGNLMAVGKTKDGMKQDTWQYFTDAPEATRRMTREVNYLKDTLNGPYKAWVNETYTAGSYAMGKLNGMHSMEKLTILGADTTRKMVETGEYLAGEKTGYWKFYKNGMVESEGTFSKDKKNGQWKYYDLTGGKQELISQSFMKDDMRDGKETIYFTRDGNGKQVMRKSEMFYIKGKRHGNFSIWLDGKLIENGQYKNDQLYGDYKKVDANTGNVTTTFYMDGEPTGPYAMVDKNNNPIEQGAYDKGRKNGKWRYYENGKLHKEEEYNVGELTGQIDYFDENGEVVCSAKVQDGVRSEITGLRNGTPYIEVYLKGVEGNHLTMDVDMIHKDSIVSAGYKVPKSMVVDELSLIKALTGDAKSVTLHGSYKVSVKGTDVVKGYFSDGQKDGKWDLLYSSAVTWQQEFKAGKLTAEKFHVGKDEAPFKGSYEATDARSGGKYEFKVKDGVRHGKQEWFDQAGNLIKETKYKEGVLEQ